MMTTITEPVSKPGNDLADVAYWQALNRKSLLRFFMLQQLNSGPMHGYEIGSRIALCCDARPTDAMIYTMLKELAAGGYVEHETAVMNGRIRKVCSLSESGVEAYRAAAKAWSMVLPQIELAVQQAGQVADCCVPAFIGQEFGDTSTTNGG